MPTARQVTQLDQRIPIDQVEIVHNAVDLRRIPERIAPIPDRPRRALAFTKTSGQIVTLREACNRVGLTFASLGHGTQKLSATPEHHLIRQDIVVATGRSAIEALCAGRQLSWGCSRVRRNAGVATGAGGFG